LVYFTVIWYIFPRFGILYQEKSGNPATKWPFDSLRGQNNETQLKLRRM
jgi:hypothetical protein